MRRLPAATERPIVGGQGQSYADALRAFDDVGVGHDVAVGIDDDSGADGVLAHDESGLGAAFFVQRAVAGDQNLDYRGRYFGGETFEGIVDLHESGGCGVDSSGLGCGFSGADFFPAFLVLSRGRRELAGRLAGTIRHVVVARMRAAIWQTK